MFHCRHLQLHYTGSGSVLGITGKDVPKSEWRAVELPDQKALVKYCASDNTGSFAVVVSDKGGVYFGGVNKKGEAGEAREEPAIFLCHCLFP